MFYIYAQCFFGVHTRLYLHWNCRNLFLPCDSFFFFFFFWWFFHRLLMLASDRHSERRGIEKKVRWRVLLMVGCGGKCGCASDRDKLLLFRRHIRLLHKKMFSLAFAFAEPVASSARIRHFTIIYPITGTL